MSERAEYIINAFFELPAGFTKKISYANYLYICKPGKFN